MQFIEYNMQNEDIVRFETFEVIGKDIYAQMIGKNILFKLNIDETEVEIINTNRDYRFKHCIFLDDKLYFADNLGEALAEYDLQHNILKTFGMNIHINNDNNIAAMEGKGESIFIISQYKGTILIFDTNNKKFEREEILEQKIKELFGEQAECTLRCWKIEEYIYVIVSNKDDYYICKYNMIKRNLEEISEKVIRCNMRNAYYFNQKLYILQDDFTLCIWDINSNHIQTMEMADIRQMIDRSKLKYKYAFSLLAVTKKNIWLFPAGENEDIYVYDLSDKIARKYDEYPSDFFYLQIENWSKYSNIKERDGHIYVAARMSNYYLIIDVETGKECWKAIGACDFSEYYHDMIAERSEKKPVIYEQNNGMFKAFLTYDQKKRGDFDSADNTGNRIWEILK